jgi:hypothetical protein
MHLTANTILALLFVLLLLGLLVAVLRTEWKDQTVAGRIRQTIMKAFEVINQGQKFDIEKVTLGYNEDEDTDYVYSLTIHLVKRRSTEIRNLFAALEVNRVNRDTVKIKQQKLPLEPSGDNEFNAGPFEIRVRMGEEEKNKAFYENLKFNLNILQIT